MSRAREGACAREYALAREEIGKNPGDFSRIGPDFGPRARILGILGAREVFLGRHFRARLSFGIRARTMCSRFCPVFRENRYGTPRFLLRFGKFLLFVDLEGPDFREILADFGRVRPIFGLLGLLGGHSSLPFM